VRPSPAHSLAIGHQVKHAGTSRRGDRRTSPRLEHRGEAPASSRGGLVVGHLASHGLTLATACLEDQRLEHHISRPTTTRATSCSGFARLDELAASFGHLRSRPWVQYRDTFKSNGFGPQFVRSNETKVHQPLIKSDQGRSLI
jgi:hypothetical protein